LTQGSWAEIWFEERYKFVETFWRNPGYNSRDHEVWEMRDSAWDQDSCSFEWKMSCLNARGVKWLGRVILKEERSLHRSGVPHEGAEAAQATPSHPFNHTSFTAKSSGRCVSYSVPRQEKRALELVYSTAEE
jgi:hypothetical protein